MLILLIGPCVGDACAVLAQPGKAGDVDSPRHSGKNGTHERITVNIDTEVPPSSVQIVRIDY
jgi:hypothetical protein